MRKKIIKRELEIKPIRDKAISIIGPRRSGKTYFLFFFKKIIKEYIDFESIEFSKLNSEEVLKIISLYKNYFKEETNFVYLDEIQNLKEFEKVVRSLLNQGYYVFISGSSSKLLSKEIATQLRGRIRFIPLWKWLLKV